MADVMRVAAAVVLLTFLGALGAGCTDNETGTDGGPVDTTTVDDAETSDTASGSDDSAAGDSTGDSGGAADPTADAAVDVPLECGDNLCAPGEDCEKCSKDCGSCDDVYAVEGEHFDQGSESGVDEAGDVSGKQAELLGEASNEAAGIVDWDKTKATYTFQTKTGPHKLCARLASMEPPGAAAVSTDAGRLQMEEPGEGWQWVCGDYTVTAPVTELSLSYWSGSTYVDKLVMLPADVDAPTGKGPEVAETCGNRSCQTHESCESCKECCEPSCGNDFCHPDETCESCADDCGACGSVYTGYCRTSADIDALPARHWCVVPESYPDQAEKKPDEWSDYDGEKSESYNSYQRVQGFSALIGAWNSGVLDTTRQRMILFGGGHNDYGGNELIAFSLKDLTWRRIADPTAFPNRAPDYTNDDGTPISRHTYAGLAYVSETDRFFALGGAPDSGPGGCGTPGTWTFDLAARASAQSYDPGQWNKMSGEGEPETKCEDNAIYDPDGKRVLYSTGSSWHAWDVTADTWSKLNGQGGGSKATYTITDGREMVGVGGGTDGYLHYDLTAGNLAPATVETSGDRALESKANPGIAYDPVADRVIGWYGGTDVYALNLESDEWTKRSAAEGNAAAPGGISSSGGVYGRFRYSEALNVYVMVDSTTENVFLYRYAEK